jgi:hypothetical protein
MTNGEWGSGVDSLLMKMFLFFRNLAKNISIQGIEGIQINQRKLVQPNALTLLASQLLG